MKCFELIGLRTGSGSPGRVEGFDFCLICCDAVLLKRCSAFRHEFRDRRGAGSCGRLHADVRRSDLTEAGLHPDHVLAADRKLRRLCGTVRAKAYVGYPKRPYTVLYDSRRLEPALCFRARTLCRSLFSSSLAPAIAHTGGGLRNSGFRVRLFCSDRHPWVSSRH